MRSQINFQTNSSFIKNLDNILPEKFPQYLDPQYIQYSLKDNKVISLPFLNINSGQEEYLKYFNNCWILTEALFLSLKNQASFYQKPYHLLRHPLIFYYGHVASLYVNKMLVAGLIDQPVNAEFEKIFETGVDEMTWDVNTKNNQINWPKLEKVQEYRQEIYNLVTKIILDNTTLFKQKITQKNPLWSLLMSFEHERIHLETSSVLIRELDINYIRAPKIFTKQKNLSNKNNQPKVTIDYPQNSLINIAASTVELGKKTNDTYGWDNEYGSKKVKIAEFSVNKYLISNGEFFEFVQDNGYHNDLYWDKLALEWRKFRNISHPSFWVTDGPKGSNKFKLRTCFEIIDMQWDYPVLVNHFEAKAYCKYKTLKEQKYFRLPYEAEHNLLFNYAQDPIETNNITNFNYNLRHISENAVNINKQQYNLYDIHGNLWQWLEDNFYPLDDFAIHNYYKDFSTPCFDDKHKMIAGSSFFSTGNLASIYSRYHFREHFFQHAGFRMVATKQKNYLYPKIEFAATNPNDGKNYIIFKEQEILKILAKEDFYKKYQIKN